MVRLKSYVLGDWHEGDGKPRPLVNPATEAPVAETTTGGIDFKAVLEHARQVGGPALRAMSFAERGELLKAMSKALYNHRERLIEVAIANGGNTRGDAKFDIDGATATLSFYAYLGKTLGEARWLTDGEPEALTRTSKRFFGVHLRVPKRGAAVHINAFNFPAWGTFEKAACALLAGMPVVTKPATSTAWLTYEMVKILVDEGIMPEGTLQFIAGSTGDLLEHLGGQDAVAFTGSADTGASLRGGVGHVRNSAGFNVEADSLNAAVLGPDVERGSELWHWFVRSVHLEMTQKTGQKCTAIRRVFLPEAMAEAFVEDLGGLLDGLVIGDPSDPEVRMGPLTTASQLRDYRAGVELLATEADIVYGSHTEVEAKGVPAGTGFFAGPVILKARDAHAAEAIHRHEVFGPVVSVLAYDGSAEDAGALVAKGGGMLASSVATDDRDFMQAIGLELAAYNGRVMLVDKKVADQVTPHGMVLPNLVHGGPGRAGGGEELGGLRGLEFYTQRVALQGNRGLLEKLFS
ncbi:MAG: 3,4-dehydroadipyl-CoA semialdehyde dehydrogenase [Alphaproteobacteria bacterium]|nr:3,4-dehydroadipyl-CoA semialdehyde dehydrogenase [Alphaproteobacteria bacterium]MCB9795688.1 3,4-dehydroadipyl-CoA semialdehyde dehydrogenase [Alphaproteobacteria bacterium]